MDKAQSTFGDELRSINDEVTIDVGEILKIAKTNSTAKSQPQASSVPKSTEVSKDVTPRAPRPLRETSQGEARRDARELVLEMRENVTTRLTRRTNELLTEAALRQKLKKQKPDTRQDIIEEAVHDWLKRKGLADSATRSPRSSDEA